MEGRDLDALESALREGVITTEQYEVIRARVEAERARRTTELLSRRVLWIGLVLLAILVAFLALIYLTPGQRVIVLMLSLGITVGFSLLFWRDPEKLNLSRGLLGLGIFEATILALQYRDLAGLSSAQVLAVIVPVTFLGALLGISQDSTWLATPSVASFYIGFVFSYPPFGFDFLLVVFVLSITIALAITSILWAWKTGRLRWLREAYLRREASMGQLARGHFVLFDLFVLFELIFLFQRFGVYGDLQVSLAGLVPFLVALAGLAYAARTNNSKLLTLASGLLILVSWLFIVVSGRSIVWPVAVLVTAGVLIYLGVRKRKTR